MPKTLSPSEADFQVQSTNSSLTSLAPAAPMSSSASSARKLAIELNSICATSGRPVPAFSASRSFT